MKTQGQYTALELRLQERITQLERENTELRWENQALRTSEARYRSCFENSPISIIFIAADGRPVEANRAFEQQYGMNVAQMSDRNCNIFTDPQLIENGTLPYMQRALAGETVMEPMTYYDAGKTVPGGRFHWGQGFYYPIRDETGTVREIVEIAFDRTEQVEAEKAYLHERERASQERLAELAKANQALKKTLDCLAAQPELDTFLGQVLTILVEQLAGSGGSFWFFDDELDTEPQTYLEYDRQQIKSTAQTQHPGTVPKRPCNDRERQLRQKLRHTQKPLIHDDIANDPALECYQNYLLASGIHSILVIPLVLCDRCIGAFSIRSTQKRQYQPEELELAQALVQQVTLAIQLTRLAEQSREAAILEERNRMAQEIHDSLAQAFTGILMQLQAATRCLTANSEQSQSCIIRAQDLARAGLAQARRSVGYLSQSNAQDNDLDLCQTLTRITEQLTAGTSVQAQVCIEGIPYRLNTEVGMNLLRIAQESLTNALRHSMAQTIQISLIYDPDRIQLRIRDDGRGFDLQQTSKGFGLKGMQQRCDRIGARLEINTRLGAGTEILVVALQKVKSQKLKVKS